jgi:multisubunit Na+/H+ antiporter MnhB subunit
VVESLGTGLDRSERLRGASIYISPLVFHFAVVVVLSGVALAPRLHAAPAAALVGCCAVAGAVHLAVVTWRIASPRTPAPPHWSDLWCYGVAPLALYLLLAAAAVAAFLRLSWAPYAVAADTLALLLIGVRNAWDLVTWLAPGGSAGQGQPPAPGG